MPVSSVFGDRNLDPPPKGGSPGKALRGTWRGCWPPWWGARTPSSRRSRPTPTWAPDRRPLWLMGCLSHEGIGECLVWELIEGRTSCAIAAILTMGGIGSHLF